jgi:hypothetical protein
MYVYLNNNFYSKSFSEGDLSWSSSITIKVQEIKQLRYAGFN